RSPYTTLFRSKSLRKWCEGRFLSLPRLREWEDVHHQLKELTRGLGWRIAAKEAGYEQIHRAVIAAFVDFVAEKTDDGSYEGMQGAQIGRASCRERVESSVGAGPMKTEGEIDEWCET